MVRIFSEHVFPKWNGEDVFRSRMDVSEVVSSSGFSLLDHSFCAKAEVKEDAFEDEFIRSFLHAAKDLADAGKRAGDCSGAFVIFGHSYAIPVLFLTRHCMELTMKKALRMAGADLKTTHRLVGLWDSLQSRITGLKGKEDRRALRNMGCFVRAIDKIDKDGVNLRYPQSVSGDLTQDQALFVNCEKVVFYLDCFVRQMDEIVFEALR